MGGYGSGRYGGRPTSEACASLVLQATTFLHAGLRFGVKGTATLTFDCDGDLFPVTVTIDTTDELFPFIRFYHSRRSDPPLLEEYQVALLTTQQRYGGVRSWFECPRAGKRAVKLFLPRGGHQFWSRAAYRLGYASQRETRMDRAWRRGSRLYRSMGGRGDWRDGPPPKPKWIVGAPTSANRPSLSAITIVTMAWLAGPSRLLARFAR